MPEDMLRRLTRGLIPLILGLVAFYLIYYQLLPALWEIINFLIPLVLPFLLGLVIAAAINPGVDWCQHHLRLPRGTAVTGVMAGFLAIAIGLLTVLVSQLVVELSDLSRNLPVYADFLKELLTQVQELYLGIELPDVASGAFENAIDALVRLAGEAVSQALTWMVDLVRGLPTFFLVLLVTIMTTFFFSRDYQVFGRSLQRMLPPRWRERATHLGRGLNISFLSYLRAEALLISITGAQTLVGLVFLGVDYAVTLSVLSAILDLLPVVGPGTIFVPWAVIEFLLGNYIFGLALAVLYAIITVVRQLLEPRVLASQVGLHPLTVLAALYVGLRTIGPWGIIIGPLIVIAAKAFWQAYRSGSESD